MRIEPFFEDPWTASEIAAIQLPQRFTVACPPPETTELTFLSKSYAISAQQQGESRCAALRNAAEQRLSSEKVNAIKNLRSVAQALVSMKLPGRCTAFYEAVREAANRLPGPMVSVIVSDAWDTCNRMEPAFIAGNSKNTVFIIPVSRAMPHGGLAESVDQTRKLLSRIAPYVRVIEPYRVYEVIEAIYPEK